MPDPAFILVGRIYEGSILGFADPSDMGAALNFRVPVAALTVLNVDLPDALRQVSDLPGINEIR